MPTSNLPAAAYGDLGLPSDTVKTLMEPLPEAASEAAPNVMQAEPLPARDLAPNASSIVLYAEVLLNIRTVTLFASLRTVQTHETKAKLSTDGSTITVSHEGASATIRLPIKAKGGGDAALSLPAQPPSKEISLRLQIEEQDGSKLFTGIHAEERKANLVPWDGTSLNSVQGLRIICKNCQSAVLASGKIAEWRDLPSENWAEMMDFWHCHKPDEHHLHDHTHEKTVAKKGYAAGSRLKATEGVGFVDLASLLLKEQDCDGAQLSTEQDGPRTSVVCKHCKHILGAVDDTADGWRLWKWSIDILPSTSSLPEASSSYPRNTYNIQKWISARLLFLIENQGVRKFHVHPDIHNSVPTPSLLLWVFTPDLLFSSSIPPDDRHDPTRAMKVFYQEKQWSPPKPGEPEPASIEDVVFPKEVFGELERALRASQEVLPVNARTFQGWEVGLLERFDVGEVGGSGVADGSIESRLSALHLEG